MSDTNSPPSKWCTTLIVVGILFGIIICGFVALLFYIRSIRHTHSSGQVPNSSDKQLSKVPSESVPSNSEAATNPTRAYIGINTAERIPRLETNKILIDSAHPSVYNNSDNSSRLNFENQPFDLSRARVISQDRDGLAPQIDKPVSTLPEVSDSHSGTEFSYRDHSSEIDTVNSQGLTETINVPWGLLDSNDQPENRNQFYSTYNQQKSSFVSLLEISSGKFDTSLPSTDDSAEFVLSTASKTRPHKFSDVRIVPSAIVQTTEKKSATQIIRNRLLSLISAPTNPGSGQDSEATEVKYYWEMMQVESIDTWWELPFPPQLSPIKPEFEFSLTDFNPSCTPHSTESTTLGGTASDANRGDHEINASARN